LDVLFLACTLVFGRFVDGRFVAGRLGLSFSFYFIMFELLSNIFKRSVYKDDVLEVACFVLR
jgi:hypothetical protein